jgi:hypothetical protein
MEWYEHGSECIIGLCVSECIYPAEFPLLFSGAAGVAARKMRSPIRLGRFYFRNWANIFHIHRYIKNFVVFFSINLCWPGVCLGIVITRGIWRGSWEGTIETCRKEVTS